MIDWITMILKFLHNPVPTGLITSLDADGQLLWEVVQGGRIEGSYDSSVGFRSQGGDGSGMATELYITGNPSKFLQGHNVFGSEDIHSLIPEFVKQVLINLNLPWELAYQQAKRGDYEIIRIDIARSFCAGSQQRAAAIQNALALKSRTRRGRCQTQKFTNYWNLATRKNRWLGKSYLKFLEITKGGKKHRLPEQLPCREQIINFSESLIRFEFELYKQELKEMGITHGYHFTSNTIDMLFKTLWGRIHMSTQIDIASDELLLMKRCIRSTYLMWLKGINVQSSMPRNSFKRHRDALLGYGVDIALPNQEDVPQSNVIPMFITISATPVSTPEWAYEAGVVFNDKRVA